MQSRKQISILAKTRTSHENSSSAASARIHLQLQGLHSLPQKPCSGQRWSSADACGENTQFSSEQGHWLLLSPPTSTTVDKETAKPLGLAWGRAQCPNYPVGYDLVSTAPMKKVSTGTSFPAKPSVTFCVSFVSSFFPAEYLFLSLFSLFYLPHLYPNPLHI